MPCACLYCSKTRNSGTFFHQKSLPLIKRNQLFWFGLPKLAEVLDFCVLNETLHLQIAMKLKILLRSLLLHNMGLVGLRKWRDNLEFFQFFQSYIKYYSGFSFLEELFQRFAQIGYFRMCIFMELFPKLLIANLITTITAKACITILLPGTVVAPTGHD